MRHKARLFGKPGEIWAPGVSLIVQHFGASNYNSRSYDRIAKSLEWACSLPVSISLASVQDVIESWIPG